MSNNNSRFINETIKAIQCGKNVLITGDISDWYRYNGEDDDFNSHLLRMLNDLHYGMVYNWDIVDGFSFQRDDMQQVFLDAVNDQIQILQDFRRTRGQSMINERELHALIQPEDALSLVRYLSSNSSVVSAGVLSLSDMLADESSTGVHPEDRMTAALLLKVLQECAYISPEAQSPCYRNAIVLVAKDKAKVPQWIYSHNNDLTVVEITSPTVKERAQFLEHPDSRSLLYAVDLSAPESHALIDLIASGTKGWTIRQLDALGAYTHATSTQMTSNNCARIIQEFEFGKYDDPWAQLRSETIENAEDILGKRVLGQPYALERVKKALIRSKADLVKNGPKASLFLAGPTGTGKTELALAIAELIFNDSSKLLRFDMSEFSEPHSALRLLGAPPSYIGHEAGGQLTGPLLQDKHQVILLDEIEKAHPSIFLKLLQVLEGGRLTDGQGRTADFSESILLFSSNLGASQYIEKYGHLEEPPSFEEVSNCFMEEVKKYFTAINSPEICGRFAGCIVPFSPITPQLRETIAQKFISGFKSKVQDRYDVALRMHPPQALPFIRDSLNQADDMYGARNIRSAVERTIFEPVEEYVVFNNLTGKAELELSLQNDRVVVVAQ